MRDGGVYELRWGDQVDCRTISGSADRNGRTRIYVVHPEQVASYLAKYLTKTTEDLGLPARVKSSRHAALAGASDHAVRILKAAEWLADQGDDYRMLLPHLGMLGYRGHPITKSRGYSVMPEWERVRLSAITHADVVAWVAKLVADGYAASTVRQVHRVFSLMLDLAVRDGRLSRNAAVGVRLPRAEKGEPVFLSHRQVEPLAEACPGYDLFVRVLAYTVMRWGEATAVRVRRST